jgi:hypothetical protein
MTVGSYDISWPRLDIPQHVMPFIGADLHQV